MWSAPIGLTIVMLTWALYGNGDDFAGAMVTLSKLVFALTVSLFGWIIFAAVK